jgi:hypothetical protein
VETVFLPGEGVDVRGLVPLDVVPAVAAEIHAADMEKDLDVFGSAPDGEDQLYGHIALTRLKVAAALGALHGEVAITEPWWELAGLVMDVSNAVMDAVAVTSGAAATDAERQAGERLGERQAAADQRRDDAKVRDVAAKLLSKVGDDWGSVNAKAVIGSGNHKHIAEAWELLINTGKVEAMEYEYQPGRKTRRYRRMQH